jgi:hypothetical protein
MGFIMVFAFHIILYLISDDHARIINIILSLWQFNILCECVYRFAIGGRAVGLANAPFELLHIFDILSIALLCTYVKRHRLIKVKDKFVGLLYLYIILGTFSAIINQSSFSDYLNGVLSTIRYLSIYLLVRDSLNFPLPKLIVPFVVLSITAFIIEVFGGFNVDFRNGLFGFQYTGGMYPLLLAIISSVYLYQFLYTHKKIRHFVATVIMSEISFILMEAKAEVLIYVAWLMVILLIYKIRNTSSFLKKIGSMIFFVIILYFAWKLLPAYNQKWENVISTNPLDAIIARIHVGYVNRMKSISEIITSNEVTNNYQRYFGIGFGSAQPPFNFRWIMQSGNNNIGMTFSMGQSYIFNIYSRYYPLVLPYFSSSYACIETESGIVGIILLYTLIALCLYRAIIILRIGMTPRARIFGAVGIWQCLNFAYRTYVSNILVEYLPMAITFLILGLVSSEYYKLKYTSKSIMIVPFVSAGTEVGKMSHESSNESGV